MRVLITGSSGQLGQAIAKLLSPKYDIIGIDLRPSGVPTHVGSVGNRDLIFNLVKNVDAVIHTASLHAPYVGQFTKEQFIDTNIKGTLNLLEASVEYKIRRFVYTGTTSLYGFAMVPHNKAVWVTEELVPRLDVERNIWLKKTVLLKL